VREELLMGEMVIRSRLVFIESCRRDAAACARGSSSFKRDTRAPLESLPIILGCLSITTNTSLSIDDSN